MGAETQHVTAESSGMVAISGRSVGESAGNALAGASGLDRGVRDLGVPGIGIHSLFMRMTGRIWFATGESGSIVRPFA